MLEKEKDAQALCPALLSFEISHQCVKIVKPAILHSGFHLRFTII